MPNQRLVFDSHKLADGSLKGFLPGDQVSAHASRKDRILAILRAGALVGLLFGALMCGLWVGMNWSAFLLIEE